MNNNTQPSPITKESLAAAAGRDDAAVKELLRGGGERTGQVERVRVALDTLRRELPDTKKEEKARVARAARDLMDEHLATVQEELKTKTDVELKELETKISNARDIAVQEERNATDAVSVESVKLEVREITRDLKTGDWTTWAKYAGVALAAGVAAKWIWDHTIGWLWGKAAGDKEKPGFLRRATSWAVGLGAAALGVAGFSRLWSQNKGTLIPLALSAKEGAEAGWHAGAGETVTRIGDLLGDKGRAAEVRKKFEEGDYATEEEFNDALADALFYDRVEIVWEGTVMHFVRAGTSLTLNVPGLAASLTKLAVNRDVESGQEALAIYVKGAVVYATSFGAVQGLIRAGQTRSLSAGMTTMVTESLLWPVQVLKKANDARYYMLTKEGRAYLRSAGGLPGYHWNRMLKMTGLRGNSADSAQLLINEWRAWDELRLTARTTADAPFLAELDAKCAHIENELADVAAALKKSGAAGLPDDVQKLLDAGGDARSIATHLREGGSSVDEAAKVGIGTDDAAKLAGEALDATKDAADWTKAATDAKKALLAPDATAEATKAIERALAQCKDMGMSADDASRLLAESPQVLYTLSKAPPSKLTPLTAVFKKHGVPGLKRVSTFIAGVGEYLDDAGHAGKLLDPDLLKTIAAADVGPDAFARIAANPALRKALAENVDIAKTINSFIRWEQRLSVNGIINIGGAAISAVMLGVDIATYVDMRARLTKTIENLERSLIGAGFTRTGKNSFAHPKTGMTIDMKMLEKSVDSLSTEQSLRVAASAAGTGAALATIIAPSLALGPAGLLIVGIELVVHGALTVAEDQRNRDFLLGTPTAVLAMIGMSQTVGKSEKDVIDESSSWLWSDMLHGSETNDTQKRDLRKKAFSILFFNEVSALTKDAPDVAREILGDHDPATFLDEKNGQFWNVDFERVIKPYLAARLFQRSTDGGVRWSEFKDLKIDEGVFDWENVSLEDARMAMREAAHLYAQHLRETKYRAERSRYAELERTQGSAHAANIGDIETRAHDHLAIEAARRNTDILGTQTSFGAPLSAMPTEGSTAVERYVQGLTARLDAKASTGDETLEGARKGRAFDAPNPVDPTKTIRLEDAVSEGAKGLDEQLDDQTVQILVARGRGVLEKVGDVGVMGRGAMYANAQHLETVRDYSVELQRFPRAVARPATKAFLDKVRRISEGYSWEGAQFGGEVSGRRTDDFRGIVAALNTAMKDLETHTYHLAPVERNETREETVAAPGNERILFGGGIYAQPGDRASVWIETDGKAREYVAVDGAEKRYGAPGGTLICRSKPYLDKGKTRYDRTWSFERSTDEKGGKEFYAFTKYDGAEQPGIRLKLPAIERKDLLVSASTSGTYLPLEPQALLGARVEVAYRTPSGTVETVTQNGQSLFGKGIEPFRLTWVKTPKGELVKFVPAAGVKIVRCTVMKPSDATVATYHFEDPRQKPALASKDASFSERVKARQRQGDGSVATSL